MLVATVPSPYFSLDYFHIFTKDTLESRENRFCPPSAAIFLILLLASRPSFCSITDSFLDIHSLCLYQCITPSPYHWFNTVIGKAEVPYRIISYICYHFGHNIFFNTFFFIIGIIFLPLCTCLVSLITTTLCFPYPQLYAS